jgi:hypothetical protein
VSSILALAATLLFGSTPTTSNAAQGVCTLSNASQHDRGFALVVGNASYPGSELKTTRADACEFGQTLNNLGYSVDLRFDLGETDLSGAVQQLAHAANGKNLPIVFYFAGHGFQINGSNYLLPVDFNAARPAEIAPHSLTFDTILNSLKTVTNGPKIVILDACRADPLAQNKPTDWEDGFAPPTNLPPNTLLAYSTVAGGIAADGVGSHSPYTRALIKFSNQPGVSIEDMFKSVRDSVSVNTDGQQTPSEFTSLFKPFYFRDPIYVATLISDGDDDVIVKVNDQEIAEWTLDGGKPKSTTLKTGLNHVEVRVYNQRSYTGGIPPFGHQPEGWRYTVDFRDSSNHPLVHLQDGEDRPADNGPRHGKLFPVAKFDLLVDEQTASIAVVNRDFDFWKH